MHCSADFRKSQCQSKKRRTFPHVLRFYTLMHVFSGIRRFSSVLPMIVHTDAIEIRKSAKCLQRNSVSQAHIWNMSPVNSANNLQCPFCASPHLPVNSESDATKTLSASFRIRFCLISSPHEIVHTDTVEIRKAFPYCSGMSFLWFHTWNIRSATFSDTVPLVLCQICIF